MIIMDALFGLDISKRYFGVMEKERVWVIREIVLKTKIEDF